MSITFGLHIIAPEVQPPGILWGTVAARGVGDSSDRTATVSFKAAGNITAGDVLAAEHALRQELQARSGIPLRGPVRLRQTHSDKILSVGSAVSETDEDFDASMTDQAGVVLSVSVADCAPVLLFDPVQRAIAAIHSGWKGTRQNIAGKTVEAMRQAYGTDPATLIAHIGPCASAHNYEVGPEFEQYFRAEYLRQRGETLYFDNRRAIADQLIECGVKAGNIDISKNCTIAETSLHSYRRDGDLSGRMLSFIAIV